MGVDAWIGAGFGFRFVPDMPLELPGACTTETIGRLQTVVADAHAEYLELNRGEWPEDWIAPSGSLTTAAFERMPLWFREKNPEGECRADRVQEEAAEIICHIYFERFLELAGLIYAGIDPTLPSSTIVELMRTRLPVGSYLIFTGSRDECPGRCEDCDCIVLGVGLYDAPRKLRTASDWFIENGRWSPWCGIG